ncbi:hypothetical protein PTTG_29046 [Puccinia triticina 1-1 BBBD Race 1]|uniref:Uncharacterized protein n=1 Tax=Puccinia triticina (isolate 1-1 / race 1 (BBBD)) TaxID=630390 RepID=A0A180G732_PUCT1|nr:hypothetical protein PTTG_29046 [Puccinia triticina 1-1 BBBD Race 1]
MEINSSHELILTEVTPDNIYVRGVRPCWTQQKQWLFSIADRIEVLSLRNEAADYDQANSGNSRPNFRMVEPMWQWTQGMPFSELVEISQNIQEKQKREGSP